MFSVMSVCPEEGDPMWSLPIMPLVSLGSCGDLPDPVLTIQRPQPLLTSPYRGRPHGHVQTWSFGPHHTGTLPFPNPSRTGWIAGSWHIPALLVILFWNFLCSFGSNDMAWYRKWWSDLTPNQTCPSFANHLLFKSPFTVMYLVMLWDFLKETCGISLNPVNFPKNPVTWPYNVGRLMYGRA